MNVTGIRSVKIAFRFSTEICGIFFHAHWTFRASNIVSMVVNSALDVKGEQEDKLKRIEDQISSLILWFMRVAYCLHAELVWEFWSHFSQD